jgi:hypothetical protein
MFSFFLQSHAAAKGTAKPAYYQVIHDDNKFGANDIQKLVCCHCDSQCNTIADKHRRIIFATCTAAQQSLLLSARQYAMPNSCVSAELFTLVRMLGLDMKYLR